MKEEYFFAHMWAFALTILLQWVFWQRVADIDLADEVLWSASGGVVCFVLARLMTIARFLMSGRHSFVVSVGASEIRGVSFVSLIALVTLVVALLSTLRLVTHQTVDLDLDDIRFFWRLALTLTAIEAEFLIFATMVWHNRLRRLYVLSLSGR